MEINFMKKISIFLVILFYFITVNNVFGQHTWVGSMTNKYETFEKMLIGEFNGKSEIIKKISKDYTITKNSDGISYFLTINWKFYKNESESPYLETETFNIKRVQVRNEPYYFSAYPYKIDGISYETGPCKYYEICYIKESKSKVLIRWLKNPICLNNCYVMELLIFKKEDPTLGDNDDFSSIITDGGFLFHKKNNPLPKSK
jgi:hypothetical protein